MKDVKELCELAFYALIALAWICWRLRFLIAPALIVALAFNLSGCNSARKLATSEGAGFANDGRPAPPACLLSREGNVERWGDCPKGRRP